MKYHTHNRFNFIIGSALAASLLASCGGDTKPNTTEETSVTGTPTYTQRQQVFSMCMLSDIGAYFNGKGDLQSQTTQAVNVVLADGTVQGLIGNWQCVWGPIVRNSPDRKDPSKLADTAANMMFIARQQGTTNFIVAIAGTDPVSNYEWLHEDFDITYTLWDNKDKDGKQKGHITMGTRTGLSILTDSMKYNGMSANQFLMGTADTVQGMNIWVTGHSLGGALSPVYALQLKESWNAKNSSSINCLAAAGATPGNKIFADYYYGMLGKNTVRVWNTRDVVPHGFQADMMSEIGTIYKTKPDSVGKAPLKLDGLLIAAKTACAAQELLHGPYTQLQSDSTFAFTSAIYTKDSAAHDPGYSDTTYENQILYQHIPSYGVYFGTLSFQQAVQKVVGMPAPFFTQGAYLVPVSPSSATH